MRTPSIFAALLTVGSLAIAVPSVAATGSFTRAQPAQKQRQGVVNPPPGRQHGIVRNAPSANAAEVVQLPRGMTVNIFQNSDDGLWRKIAYTLPSGATGQGWLHRDVLSETQ